MEEPGLPDARRAKEREEVARALRHCSLKRLPQQLLLALPIHERRVVASRRLVLLQADQPKGFDSLGLALELQRRHRLRIDGIAHQSIRRRAEKDLTWAGRLLQPRGHIHGVTGDKCLV